MATVQESSAAPSAKPAAKAKKAKPAAKKVGAQAKAKKTVKTKKAKAAKAKAKPAAKTEVNGLLVSPAQQRILTALIENKRLRFTYNDVRDLTGMKKGLSRLFVSTDANAREGSLEGMGLVNTTDPQEGEQGRIVFELTAKGQKTAKAVAKNS